VHKQETTARVKAEIDRETLMFVELILRWLRNGSRLIHQATIESYS